MKKDVSSTESDVTISCSESPLVTCGIGDVSSPGPRSPPSSGHSDVNLV